MKVEERIVQATVSKLAWLAAVLVGNVVSALLEVVEAETSTFCVDGKSYIGESID